MFVVVFYLFGFLFRKSYHIPVNIALYRFYNRSLYGIFRLITKQLLGVFYAVFTTSCNMVICMTHFFPIAFVFSPFILRQEINIRLSVKEVVH